MPRSKATSTERRRSLNPTFRFVGGKGGVGKTTIAAALGLLAARRGQRTLIVSTDPAPSLGDALRQRLGPRPRAVRGMARLAAVEIDATAALAAWLDERRTVLEQIALRGTWLDADDVARLLRLSLPGIDEIAGLLQIHDFAGSGRYEHIVVDTAPTGHLLRMIGMPSVLEGLAEVFDRMQAKHRIVVDALRGGWIPDAADTLIHAIDGQARGLGALLRDPARCRLSWATLPEDMAIEETSDGLRALGQHGIAVDQVVVNRMTPRPGKACQWCDGRRGLERKAVRILERRFRKSQVSIQTIPSMAAEPHGIRALSGLARHLLTAIAPSAVRVVRRRHLTARLADGTRVPGSSLFAPPETQLLLFGGKGGVGKTTCATAVAVDVAAAAPDRRVLLLSADPAHSIGDLLRQAFSDVPRSISGGPPNLMVRELDASRGYAALRDRFARGIDELSGRTGGGSGDRQVLHDLLELAPPGVDELVAIIEVVERLGSARAASARDLVVIDTAPTGHALRLLEMPALVHDWVKAVMAILLKYQPVVGVGELGAALLRLSQGLARLRALLTDPARTRFVVVTRPAVLPRAETLRLLARLEAASIGAPVVIVNAVGAGTCVRCRSEHARHQKEVRTLSRALTGHRRRTPSLIVAPATVPPPAGWREVRSFYRRWRQVPL